MSRWQLLPSLNDNILNTQRALFISAALVFGFNNGESRKNMYTSVIGTIFFQGGQIIYRDSTSKGALVWVNACIICHQKFC